MHHFSWFKLAEAAAPFICLDVMKYAQKYTTHLLCYAISLEEKASGLLQCISRSTIREFWICINPHARSVAVSASFLPMHIAHRSLPCCMELFFLLHAPISCISPCSEGRRGLDSDPSSEACLLSNRQISALRRSRSSRSCSSKGNAWSCNGSPRREHHEVPVQQFYECNPQSPLTSYFF